MNETEVEQRTKIWVTGATGFIGQALLAGWQARQDWAIEGVSLRGGRVEEVAFQPSDVVLHLAGLAHQMHGVPADEYRRVNLDLPLALARWARACGVRQFVLISTVKVYGESTLPGAPVTEATPCHPRDGYSQSKLEAEEALRTLEEDLFTVTILRIPLVCGPGVKGNLQRLMALVLRVPLLPLGGIDNRRSLLTIETLRSALERLIALRAGGTFLITDHPALSTTELVVRMAQAGGRCLSLLPCPRWVQRLASRWRPSLAERLFGSFELDDTQTRARLGMSGQGGSLLADGITRMVRAHQRPVYATKIDRPTQDK